jgi:membrane fusion protein, copper/silver efflux system
MSPQSTRRTVYIGSVIAIIIVIGSWAIFAATRRNANNSAVSPSAAAKAMPGMSGMAGMDAAANGSVTLTANQIRQFGVTFGVAEVRPLIAETRATGVVTFDETRLAQVTTRVGGFVERLHVNTTGQQVSRGQPLLEIYSPELVAAQQELLLAAQLQRDMGRSAVPGVPGNATDLLSASRRRLELWDITPVQIDEILHTGRVRRTLTLFAPASGVVVEKNVLQGRAVSAGEQLYTIAGLGDVWIDVRLREPDAATVRTGSGADVEVVGLPGRVLKGRVMYVYPTLDSVSRAVRARVVVANSAGLLKPGMYATLHLTSPSRAALVIPAAAILRTGERNVVFIDMGRGALKPVDVSAGRTVGDYTEILGGIQAGQRVVTSAQFLLDSESNLGEVMKSMISQR